MTALESDDSIGSALTDLIMNCPDLAKLESRLARFNIFRVLRADRDELRHSNFLAWMFKPDEAHGLGDLFLRRWLMNVLQGAGGSSSQSIGRVSPVAVDVLDIDNVDVYREMENIDLLVVINRKKGSPWVICIENKVDSAQHSEQLSRYRTIVERRFAEAERRIYVFLTKNSEAPDHEDFIQTSYKDVSQVLHACIDERHDSIGAEPLLLLKHYCQLLDEDFMEESESSRLARQIYLRHKEALDFIFENKVDIIYEASEALGNALLKSAGEMGIIIERRNKGWVRFLPPEWDTPANTGGNANWGPNSRFLACEVGLWGKTAELHMAVVRAPDDIAEFIWNHAKIPPLKKESTKRPTQYIKLFKVKSEIKLENLVGLDSNEIATLLLDWLKIEMQKPRYKEAVNEFARLLSELKAK